MLSLSVTCLAIAAALKNGTLRVEERTSRLGGSFFAICDDLGLIEVANDKAELDARLSSIKAQVAA